MHDPCHGRADDGWYTARMSLLRLYRRFGAWLAILAILAGALTPVAAQAMFAGQDRADWMEVCSVSGMVWVKADTGEVSSQSPDGGMPDGDMVQHCPWCTLHGGVPGLPVAESSAGVMPVMQAFPLAFYRVPARGTVWAPAQSRAPPLTA